LSEGLGRLEIVQPGSQPRDIRPKGRFPLQPGQERLGHPAQFGQVEKVFGLQARLHVFQERFHLLRVEFWQRRQGLFVDVLIPPTLPLIEQRLQAGQRLGVRGLSRHRQR
jgi:hypothetical protein